MEKHATVKHGTCTRRLRGLLATGVMASALIAGPAIAKQDPGPKKPTPVKKTGCVRGERQKRYVSHERKFSLDHSYVRVTWEPRFCAQDNEWVTKDVPVLEQVGAGKLNKIILELEAPHHLPDGIEYRGAVRQCTSVSVGHKGIGTTGEGCYTMGKATFRARVDGKKKVSYAWDLNTTKWIKKTGGGKLKWTNKVV